MSRPTALVTGAARGIGQAVALALAERGWQVVAGVRDRERCDLDHPHVNVIELDVTNAAQVRAGVAAAEHIGGGALTAVVSNAGHAMIAPFEDLDLATVREMFEVNTFGAVAVAQAALPAMRAAGRGRLVFVSSVGVHLDTPYLSAYRASKAALNAFADTLAMEVREYGIRVSRVEPGMVATEFSASTRRSDSLTDPESPYASMSASLIRGMREWREWVNIPADDVAERILALLDDAEPPASVLVGEDAEHLVTLDANGLRRFFHLDSQ